MTFKPSLKHTIRHGDEIVEVRELDQDWHQLRIMRDNCLENCDWRAVKDRVLPNEWKEYRQALRDITNYEDPVEAVKNWPVTPDA